MKKLQLLCCMLFLMGNIAYAQFFTGLSYSTSYTTGDFNSYISKPSFRGMALDFRNTVRPNLLIGASFAWNVFYENKGQSSYTWETVTMTGKQFSYTNATPLMASFDYAGSIAEGCNGFVGMGIGTTYINRVTDFGGYEFQSDTWQFLISPEAGIAYVVSDYNSLYLSARYNINFENQDMEGQQYFSINLGIAWGNR